MLQLIISEWIAWTQYLPTGNGKIMAALTWALLTIIRITLCSMHSRLSQWGAVREEKRGRGVRDVERYNLGDNIKQMPEKEEIWKKKWVSGRQICAPTCLSCCLKTDSCQKQNSLHCSKDPAPAQAQWEIKVLCEHTFISAKANSTLKQNVFKNTWINKLMFQWLLLQWIDGKRSNKCIQQL